MYLGAANEKLNYEHQDGGIISVLLKKIWDLEERDREFDRKLEEIDVLKERLDEAQRRLTNMQELEYRLEKAEERIRMLENRVDNNKENKSAAMKVVDTNGTHDTTDIGSSSRFSIRRAVSNMESRQTEMGDKIAELMYFKNRVQTALKLTATINRKRTVTRKAAFTAMYYSAPVSITPGRSLQFDRVDYNEGNAYDKKTGIFTCPISGTYFFYTNIISMFHAGSIQTEIVLEGQGKGRTHANKVDNHAQGSTAASLHCDAGQRVWVQAVYGSQTWGEMLSSFTGVLMWQDETATNSN
ncbi:hypothetical protein CHS0354_042314 [Potamilus streckersoni]|uniref:C1q domain-containing protein n=1 Tax=Potamilus streckersoni TaxID=2493646 RepID=A0AAE0SUE2_9BIVA|nr:hypothetical protein CHS0354_042314 [Potamilus streckersoni]